MLYTPGGIDVTTVPLGLQVVVTVWACTPIAKILNSQVLGSEDIK